MSELKNNFFDMSKGYLPVAIVVGLAALLFQAGAAYTQLTGGSNQMRADIVQIQADVVKLTQGMTTISQQLTALQALQPEREVFVRKAEFELYTVKFCREIERSNKGFRCP